MKQCEDYNEINLYNTLVKKINEIIDELNKVDLQKLEMQRLLNTAYEIKNDLTKIYMDDKQVLDTIDNNLKSVNDSVKLINLLNIENKVNRLVAELEGNHIRLTGSKNGIMEIDSIQGNTLWIDNDTEEILSSFDDSKDLRLQSCFEDKLVTQEMVDNGEELAKYLGKYRVDYKVTGKNKFDKNKAIDGYELQNFQSGDIGENSEWFVTDYIPVIPNTKYTITGKANGAAASLYDSNKITVFGINSGCANGTITIPSNARYIRLNGLITQKDTFQLEEGSTGTAYESYKSYTKTIYLNNPLLEGDTIEQQGNNLIHVHRYKKVQLNSSKFLVKDDTLTNTIRYGSRSSYVSELLAKPLAKCISDNIQCSNNSSDDDYEHLRIDGTSPNGYVKLWLNKNRPITDIDNISLIYELASPTIEIIGENDIDIMECFEGCSIDYDTVIPVQKTKVVYTGKEEITTYAIEDDILLNDSGIELNSNDEEVF